MEIPYQRPGRLYREPAYQRLTDPENASRPDLTAWKTEVGPTRQDQKESLCSTFLS